MCPRGNYRKWSPVAFQRLERDTEDSPTVPACYFSLIAGAGREEWSWRGLPQPGGVQAWDTCEVTAGYSFLCETSSQSHSACSQGRIHHREPMGKDRTEGKARKSWTSGYWSILIQDLPSGLGFQCSRPFAELCTCLFSISKHNAPPSVLSSPLLTLEVNCVHSPSCPISGARLIPPTLFVLHRGFASCGSIFHISHCSQSQTAGTGCLPCGEPLAGSLQPLPGLRAFRLSWGTAGSLPGLPCAELQGATQVPGVPVW